MTLFSIFLTGAKTMYILVAEASDTEDWTIVTNRITPNNLLKNGISEYTGLASCLDLLADYKNEIDKNENDDMKVLTSKTIC